MDYDKLIGDLFPLTEPPSMLVTGSADAEGEDQAFQDNTWDKIDSSVLECSTFILHCFTPEALVYYLPAYIRYAFNYPDSAVADAIVERVLPPAGGESRSSFLAWWSLLNPEQRALVLQLVSRYRDRGGIVNMQRLTSLKQATQAENR